MLYDEQKRHILECLGRKGLHELFGDEVCVCRPAMWDGYEIAHFYNPNKPNFDEMRFLDEKTEKVAETLEFPKNQIHEAALYFWLCRHEVSHAGYGSSNGLRLEADADGQIERCGETYRIKWSLFFLMYLDSLTWKFPKTFLVGKKILIEQQNDDEPRMRYLYGAVCRQLCGVRTDSARVFYDRSASAEELKDISSKTERLWWDKLFVTSEKSPELILALSFHANGFAAYKTKSKPEDKVERDEYLLGLIDRATNYRVNVPDDDWEARAVFFLLAQWLFFRRRCKLSDTLEGHVFAILYLRFYRQGVDEYLGRDSMRIIWNQIPYSEKEKTAQRFRRMLVDTRNSAARKWPDAETSDCPEVENSVAFGFAFSALVRKLDFKRLDMLLKEASVYAPYRDNELLWAACHSKKMYRRLVKLVEKDEKIGYEDYDDEMKVDILKGWKALPIEDLAWSYETIKAILPTDKFEALMVSAQQLLRDDDVELPRLCAFLEVLHINPNRNPTDAAYDTSYPPLAFAIHGGVNLEKARALLEHGANPNCGGHRWTCLCAAAQEKDTELLRLLLKAGASPNLPATSGLLPIVSAIRSRNVEALKLLVEAGANPASADGFDEETMDFWLSQPEDVRALLGSDFVEMKK